MSLFCIKNNDMNRNSRNVWLSGGFLILLQMCIVHRAHAAEIDLIEGISNLSSSKPSVHHSTIWSLDLTDNSNGNNFLSENAKKRTLQMISMKRRFSLCVTLNQNNSNSGTIFAITYQQRIRFFEIRVSLKRKFVKILYFPNWKTYGYRIEKLAFTRTSDNWTSLCISYDNGSKELSLSYECTKVDRVVLKDAISFKNMNFENVKEFEIWIGQRTDKKGFFKGMLQKMIFSDTSKYSQQYCSTVLSLADSTVSMGDQLLSDRVSNLERDLVELKQQLAEMQKYVKDYKQCQCFPKCVNSNGEVKSFGDKWNDTPCTNCTCTLSGNVCEMTRCAALPCNSTITDIGKCCPRCPYNCQYQRKKYIHNQGFSISCMECHCFDGTLSCRRINPEVQCPKLNCHKFLQVKTKGQCCKKCKVLNLCELTKCGQNANCVESSSVLSCQCRPGYHGDPFKGCIDIDECQVPNNCPSNNECINTDGSYSCICKSGYIKINDSSNICKATCPRNPCQNNSTCIGLNQCQCKSGFMGSSCDIDIDECQLGVINCPLNSECINTPGAYICQCISGYHSIRNDTLSISFSHQCEDINECIGTRGLQYHCATSSSCVNIPGGYQCIPKSEDLQLFGSNCAIQKQNGYITRIYDNTESNLLEVCRTCFCQKGVLQCGQMKCGCSIEDSLPCCPACSKSKCNWSEAHPGSSIAPKCMLSNTSCTQAKCPVVTCKDPVLLPGQCCRYCKSDYIVACIMVYDNEDTMQPGLVEYMPKCVVGNVKYNSGKNVILQKFQDGSCLKCLCWNGEFCCGKSFGCNDA